MERIHTLIDKLSQQKAQAASPAHLLFTVQLLQQELLQLQKKEGATPVSRVAVTLPFNTTIAVAETVLDAPVVEAIAVEEEPVAEKEIYVLDIVEEEQPEDVTPFIPPVAEPKEYSLRKPVVQERLFEEPKPVVRDEPRPTYMAQQLFNTAFETNTVEVPTLAQYAAATEVHERLAEKKESLNDRLKREQTELAQVLKETPIKDLRKGIGINDRFAFVRELFRGDDAAYERSIKTINSFGIYSEAEYWISRELKLKLGWDEKSETVQHFYQLVRRRFS